MRLRDRVNPAGVIWILLSIIIVLAGYLFTVIPFFSSALGESIAQGIGASVVATGITNIVIFVHVRFADDLRVRFESLQVAGISRAFPGRSLQIRDEYEKRIINASEIEIIGFGLARFREDFESRFAEWSKNKSIKILLIDPEFPSRQHSYASQRDIEEGHSSNTIENDVNVFIAKYKENMDIVKSHFLIKYSKTLPSINYFRIDDEIFWGPYLVKKPSRNMPTFIVNNPGYLYNALKTHFNDIWNDPALSRPID